MFIYLFTSQSIQYGDTPLNAAAGNGHIEAVQELINVDGCDVNIPNTVELRYV